MTKSIQKMFRDKGKGTRVYTTVEISAKSSHSANICNQLQDAIDSGSITTKGEKLNTIRKLAQGAYTAASPKVQASCITAVQAEHDAKASEVLKKKCTLAERTNSELAK